MNDPNLYDTGMGNDLLTRIEEGMEVYDIEDKKIGEVETIYFGEVDQERERRGERPATASTPEIPSAEHPLVDFAFGGAFSSDEEEEEGVELIRARLQREGFVKIDGSGLFGRDYYAMPDQIASISGDHVRLRVSKDELIER